MVSVLILSSQRQDKGSLDFENSTGNTTSAKTGESASEPLTDIQAQVIIKHVRRSNVRYGWVAVLTLSVTFQEQTVLELEKAQAVATKAEAGQSSFPETDKAKAQVTS